VLDAIAHDPAPFTAAALRAVAVVQLRRLEQAATMGVVRTEDVAAACEVLLRQLAALPGQLSRMLAGDPDVVRFLATTDRLDAEVVELTIATGLGEAAADGAVVLGHLVALADDTNLATPALVGTARGLGAHLAEMTEGPTDPDRTVRLTYGSAATPIGTFGDVVAMLGQVVDDVDAQRALGATLRGFVDERVGDGSAAALAAQATGATVAERRRAMARELGALTSAIGLVDLAAAHQTGGHERALAASRAQHKWFFDVTSIGGGMLGGPLLGQGVKALSIVVARLTGDAEPRSVPDAGARSSVRGAVDVELLAAAVDDPSLRTALGLDGVAESTWEAVAEHLDALGPSLDSDEADARWDALVDAIEDTELAAYLFDVTTDSGVVAADRPAG
jgi:hypothetical protein